ncbi:NAD(P)-dependent dehydrogenase (Short-subunit alcohol dehydrogenase family) [Paraburkholderia tropica]|nr:MULTISPECIES: glucose 1-dehydrogenase [unclassified Paraburkholderia]CAG9233370.1 NAD(P)-dependent dehydrogenase (Short-subunit alcohol dehydrogenase family) [Paraburkholderia tropica]
MIHALYDLRGKHALVTGASRGIGLAIARALGQAGASVVIASNDAAEGEACARTLREAEGIDAEFCFLDAGERASVEAMWAYAVRARGAIDIVVCNAGVAPHLGPLVSASDDAWTTTMNVNLHSAVWLANLAAPAMAARGGGSIILTSSISGVRGNKAIGVYGVSKAAVAALARNLAVEWGPHNVRANAISPGMIATEFARPLLDNAEVRERRMLATPLRRPGTPEEIAGVALMLAAPGGAFITGQNVIVDGGTTISDGN